MTIDVHVIKSNMKDTGNTFVTADPLPGGMSAYNTKTKRYVRWRKGYDQPAPATDVVLVPTFLFLNKKYLYWNDLGYYEMGLKDSSDFRSKLKATPKSKRGRSDESRINQESIKVSKFEMPTPRAPSSPPFCPWEIDRLRNDAKNSSAREHHSDDDTVAETFFPSTKSTTDSPRCMSQHNEGPTSSCSVPRFYQSSQSPQRLASLPPLQPTCASTLPLYPMQRPAMPTPTHFAPYVAAAPPVYSYSTQTVTHSMSVTQPTPPPPADPKPTPTPQPEPELPTSTEIALVPPAESVPWYVSHTPAAQHSFVKGDHVRVTAGTYSGCNGRVTGLAKAGNKVLHGQLKVRVMQNEGEDCTVFIAMASLEARSAQNTQLMIAEAHTESRAEQGNTHTRFEEEADQGDKTVQQGQSSGLAADNAIDLCCDN